jgi:hypothetical protein
MKDMKKILLIQLPLAVEQALTEQLKPFSSLKVISLKKIPLDAADHMPDLVVTGGGTAEMFSGCPVFPLSEVKPWRLGTLLRQIGQMLAQPVLYIDDISIGPYVFKPQEKSLARPQGEEISLTDREVDILAYLVRHRDKPVSRDELLKNVWKYQEGLDTHTLETHIYRLRQKIEISAEDPRILLTVEGGYSLNFSGAAPE